MNCKFSVFLVVALASGVGVVCAQEPIRFVPANRIPCLYGIDTSKVQHKLPTTALNAAVRVWLDKRGTIIDVVLMQSSGNGTFDELAVAASRQALCKAVVDGNGQAILAVTNFTFTIPASQFRPALGADSFIRRVERRVRANMAPVPNPQMLQTVVAVHCMPDGRLLSATIVRSSGNADVDTVALTAVRRSDPMPVDNNGRTPGSFLITVRPGAA